jgi:hypothetical protein
MNEDKHERLNTLYQKDLSLFEMETLFWERKECERGVCKLCSVSSCQMKAIRKTMLNIKPSFCPGDYRKCGRVKFQTCRECRATNMDWNIKNCLEKQPYTNEQALKDLEEVLQEIERREKNKTPNKQARS